MPPQRSGFSDVSMFNYDLDVSNNNVCYNKLNKDGGIKIGKEEKVGLNTNRLIKNCKGLNNTKNNMQIQSSDNIIKKPTKEKISEKVRGHAGRKSEYEKKCSVTQQNEILKNKELNLNKHKNLVTVKNKKLKSNREKDSSNPFSPNNNMRNINKREDKNTGNDASLNEIYCKKKTSEKNYTENKEKINDNNIIYKKENLEEKNYLKINANKISNELKIKLQSQKIAENKGDEVEESIINMDEIEENYTNISIDSGSEKIHKKIGPNDFICLAALGQGSFGEVYLVKKKSSDDYYAMKVLDKEKIEKQNIYRYTLTERNVLTTIKSPFVVKLNYAFQTSAKLFLLLDYCPGGDLSKQLQILRRFPEEKAKFYLCEITLAIGDIHKKDIIYRDLKPDNVVIDRTGHAMLTDFGLSKEGVTDEGISKSFCGSIAYLAPEMISRKGHGKPVDWYLLGVIFYEMLVGFPPYFTNNQEKIFKNIEKGKLYMPNYISHGAADLIKALLRREPEFRLGARGDVEEVKAHPYFKNINWTKVYNRMYIPPKIVRTANLAQFFRKPKEFVDDLENEDDDLFEREPNYEVDDERSVKCNKQEAQMKNHYEGWSFVQNTTSNNKDLVKI